MMYSTGIVFFSFIMMSIGSIPFSDAQSSSPVLDMFIKTLVRTFETPITVQESEKVKFSLDIMLKNDVFTLDDVLRLFIQQFIIALFNGRIEHFPDDWETRYPAYDRVINEINDLLDIIGKRPLSEITMKHIRPLVQSKPSAPLSILSDETEAATLDLPFFSVRLKKA